MGTQPDLNAEVPRGTFRVPVLWVSRHDDVLARGYADQGLLEAVLARELWVPADPIVFDHHEVRGDFPDVPGALVVINCRTHASDDDVAWFLGQLDRLEWSVVLLCGDEEWGYPWQRVTQHDRRRVWAMQARPEHVEAGLTPFPGGWYPHTRERLVGCHGEAAARDLDWFFAGQVTHERRLQCANVLRRLRRGLNVQTDHYLDSGAGPDDRGINGDAYMRNMARAKVAPSPSGPYSVDCARTYEALEAGTVPVADTVTAFAGQFDYWALLYGEPPLFPRVEHWRQFPRHLAQIVASWPQRSNEVYAQWQQWKRRIVCQLDDDLRAVARMPRAAGELAGLITVVVTTSPAPLHPSTEHLEQVIASVREQLPDAPIVVACDGVRPENEHLAAAYHEYVRRVCWMANMHVHHTEGPGRPMPEWRNVVPVVASEWLHQAGLTRLALAHVATPLLLFVEHDTPLVGTIDWPNLARFVTSGEAYTVRFHQDATIHPDHERVMLDHAIAWPDLPVRRTVAWWQRPHLSATEWYRDRLLPMYSDRARTMIEEVAYAVLWNGYQDHGETAWGDWRVWVYTPELPDDYLGMRRSGHLDSRGDEPKGPMLYDYDGEPPAGAPEAGWR